MNNKKVIFLVLGNLEKAKSLLFKYKFSLSLKLILKAVISLIDTSIYAKICSSNIISK